MSDILTRKEGRAGRITFNRPAALNALSHEMSLAIEAKLDAWRGDAEVDLVIIDAVGERAFCAGGDIAAVYHAGKAGQMDAGRDFWADEYRMNAKIAEYPKPIVAFMQGFVMGGGVGISAHGSHRIVTERTKLAMPETGIGLFPDVGGGWFLSRLEGRVGPFLALTGARLDGAECLWAGLATHYLPSANLAEAKARIAATAREDRSQRPLRHLPRQVGGVQRLVQRLRQEGLSGFALAQPALTEVGQVCQARCGQAPCAPDPVLALQRATQGQHQAQA